MMTMVELWLRHPLIRWHRPVEISWTDPYRQTYACRVCIANLGLNAESLHQWKTEEEALAHIVEEHMP